MTNIFHCIDLRRHIFNFKSQSIKKQATQKYQLVLNEFKEHLNNIYSEKNDWEWDSLDNTQIANLSQNEYFNFIIEELVFDKYFNMSYWLLDRIKNS